jgi:hypothetical protein
MDGHRGCAAVSGLLLGMAIATAALAQARGILRVQHRDSPASMSILEEGTTSAISRTQPRAMTTAAVAGSFLIGTSRWRGCLRLSHYPDHRR